MQTNPFEIFATRTEKFRSLEKKLIRKHNNIALLRLLIFLAGTVLSAALFIGENYYAAALCLLLFFPLFIFFVIMHRRTALSLKHTSCLAEINEQETERLHGRLDNFEGGNEFADPAHFYSDDLDIFGKNSLFSLLNRAATTSGKAMLAAWLKEPDREEEIKQRQQAAEELSAKIDWRQNFQARGMQLKAEDPMLIQKWLREPYIILNTTLLRYVPFIVPPFLLMAFALTFFGISDKIVWALVFVNIFFAALNARKVRVHSEKAYERKKLLLAYSLFLKDIESETFVSPRLQNIQSRILQEGRSASAVIDKLAHISAYLDYRKNIWFSIFANSFLSWDLYWMLQLEKWKAKNGVYSADWFETVFEFEAISSIAALRFANPAWTFPEISGEKFRVRAEEAAHPLIPYTLRVSNDLEFQGLGKTLVVTGSNMSGKSTFLRTLGINTVLALCGAPVCAKKFEVSSLLVFTSMRTADSLSESTSSFYAELKRLRQLLEILNPEMPVFYLLDEILKGTNSADRHLGTKALIRQLHKENASGIISTHDLELGAMEKEDPERIKNFSFNSEIINGRLNFDYKLNEGICHSFNASELMKNIGIKL